MAGIWAEDDSGWRLSRPLGFRDEAKLRDLIKQTPEMLPLSGAPRLVIVGEDIPIGSGRAGLVGVESSGRMVIIEVNLSDDNDSLQAVVAQILTYAASLHGTTRAHLEAHFSAYLREQGHKSISESVSATASGAFDAERFDATLDDHLSDGRCRVVLVLGSVPRDLMTLAAYLEHVSGKMLIDLVAVNAFDIGGASVVLPQRVTPESLEEAAARARREDLSTEPQGRESQGSERFEAAITSARQESQASLRLLVDWARNLERQGLARLVTYEGKQYTNLLLRVADDTSGMVIVRNDGGAAMQLWRSVFERLAPHAIERIEGIIGARIGKGNVIRDFGAELLANLTEAYRDASKAAV